MDIFFVIFNVTNKITAASNEATVVFALYEKTRKRSGKEGLIISTCLLEQRVEALDLFMSQKQVYRHTLPVEQFPNNTLEVTKYVSHFRLRHQELYRIYIQNGISGRCLL